MINNSIRDNNIHNLKQSVNTASQQATNSQGRFMTKRIGN